jgi:DNA polymerase-3 subunit gamma/tau
LAENESTYQSLYRKWRPQAFAEVVGQEYTLKTLTNAISRDEIAHAYIFSGPRGTGKTTIARIFSKAVNCPNGKDGEPCNECSVCERITRGSALDVIEIDGASNRGIDQIRQLREEVNFASTECPHKVYIIDEVHMLTNEAFNALLKTLEEPPKHVIFIFATTEAHKVPATVLSRCQAFEFRQIPQDQIQTHLSKIAKAEGVEAEDGALEIIARHARGGMRDALTLFEQLISFKGQDAIKTEDLYEILGLPSDELLDEFLDVLIANNRMRALEIIADLSERGRDFDLFLRESLHRSRHHLMTKIDGPDDATSWIRLTSDLLDLKREMRYAFDKRILFEVKALEMTTSPAQVAASEAPVKAQPAAPQSTPKPTSVAEAIAPQREQKSEPVAAAPKQIEDAQPEPAMMKAEESTIEAQHESQPEVAPPAPVSVPSGAGRLDEADPKSWARLLHDVKAEKIAIHALLAEAQCRVENSIFHVEYSPDFGFHKERMDQKANIEFLKSKVSPIFGDLTIKVGFSTDVKVQNPDAPKMENDEFKKKIEMVREAFDGEIVHD